MQKVKSNPKQTNYNKVSSPQEGCCEEMAVMVD